MKLDTPILNEFRLIEPQRKALAKLGIKTVSDLLYHFPVRYGDTSQMMRIEDLKAGDSAVIFGKISALKTSKAFIKKIPMSEARIEDESGSIKAIWFHQPYIAKMIAPESFVRAEGKVSERRSKKNELYLTNPKIESVTKLPIATGGSLFGKDGVAHSLYPVYPESRGITSNWMYHAYQKIFKSGILDDIEDPIPQEILQKYNLPTWKTAMIWIHQPQNEDDALSARKRFAFEEIFFIQLRKLRDRKLYEKHNAFQINKIETPLLMHQHKTGSEDKYASLDNDLGTISQDVTDFISRFPFTPTSAQIKAIKTILNDFAKNSPDNKNNKGKESNDLNKEGYGRPMSRLLEGDVGSGKTAVAAATVYAVVTSRPIGQNGRIQDFGNLQVAYMAPTEILAKQHFESFIKYFKHLPINIALITGSGAKKFPSKVAKKVDRSSGQKTEEADWTDISKAQLLKWVSNGEIPVLIGTHALIQKSVKFKNLAYVIIDEQHRFGTAQRQKLMKKEVAANTQDKSSIDKSSIMPHLLSMTATPIPRTLALTIYGDLDLTLLDEMPAGRKPIETEIVLPGETARQDVYNKIHKELEAGRQAYIICARIDEADPDKEGALNARSVKEEAERLKKKIFSKYSIAILHSKMKTADKDAVMLDFADKKIDILVATSVVEVGVNVPNATVIVIEGAERFGLAQLHQLRGRVIRSNHQAYCYLFADAKSQKTIDRLDALKKARNGFELAEYDLSLRGAGELYGRKQWGLSDIAMEAIKNIKMVEAARTEAARLIDKDEKLASYPSLRVRLDESSSDIHFE